MKAKENSIWLLPALCIWISLSAGLGFCTLDAEVVTIGEGDQLCHYPLDFGWESTLYECLYYPEELGFASATLDSLSFYNMFYSHPINGATKIWMGSTCRPGLSDGWIPANELSLVFDGTIDYPIGQNTITIPLPSPFTYSPGNLVLLVQRPYDSHWLPGVNGFWGQGRAQPRAREYYHNYHIDPSEPPAGTSTNVFPRTTFYFRRTSVNNDLACNGLSGHELPPAGIAANYQTCVFNNGSLPQSGYTVKLFNSDNQEIASLDGGTIQPLQAVYHTFSWTPTAAGTESLQARVFLPGDDIPSNDQSVELEITVLTEGLQAITIGGGDMQNRQPVDFSRPTSLWQCLYYPDELGFTNGTINSLAFYNRFTQPFPNEPLSIWMGSTYQTELSPDWIPSSQLNLVYNGTISFPAGQNRIMIPLQTPYNHYYGNLVVMLYRPFSNVFFDQPDYFRCQRGTQNRAQMLGSSSLIDPADPPFSGLITIFPKTTFIYSELSTVHDLMALSLSGNPMPSVGIASEYRITICNQGNTVQENFTVKLVNEDNTELGSVTINSLSPSHTQDITLNWTPDTAGYTNLYGKVILAADEVPENNTTPVFPVNVQAAGTLAITIGNGGSTGRMPLDMYFHASLFETIYPASELNITGEINSLQFYNDFINDIPNQATKIWMGETNWTDLASGWIPSPQMTPVFDGYLNFPAGENDILIPLQTPYQYAGANLVLMVQRPLEYNSYSSQDAFVTQNGPSMARSRLLSSDSINFDPAAPLVMGFTAMYPQTTFIFNTGSEISENTVPPALSALGMAHPNPFMDMVAIDLNLTKQAEVSVKIYNLKGQVVKSWQPNLYAAGRNTLSWDATNDAGAKVASGVYIWKVQSGSLTESCKVVVSK